MHIFERDWHPGNIYSTKWLNGAKNGLTVWSGKNRSDINKSPVKDIAFRHYICSYNVNFVLSILKVIDQLECKLRCYQKLYGQMQKTTDNVLFDYWRGFAGVNRSVVWRIHLYLHMCTIYLHCEYSLTELAGGGTGQSRPDDSHHDWATSP